MFKAMVIVALVSKFVLIYSRDTVISVRFDRILPKEEHFVCRVLEPSYTITEGHQFTLDIFSHYYIFQSWLSNSHLGLQDITDMKNTTIFSSYKGLPTPSLNYSLQYTETASNTSMKFRSNIWIFQFEIMKKENKYPKQDRDRKEISRCETEVFLVSPSADPIEQSVGVNMVTVILGTFSAVVVLVQSAYIIYFRVKSRAAKHRRDFSNTSDNVYTINEDTLSIAERPPLPLPHEVKMREGPKSPMSPAPPRRRSLILTPPQSPPSALKNVLLNKNVEQMPRPPPIPGPSPSAGQFRKPEALPPLLPVPRGTPVRKTVRRNDWQDSSDEEWEYEPLKPMF